MHFQGILGLIALTAFCWAVSENRNGIKWKTILAGFAAQFALALIMLKIPITKEFFGVLNHAVMALEKATTDGTSFVFGYLGGGSLPFEEKGAGSSFVFAFKALPLVLVVNDQVALSAIAGVGLLAGLCYAALKGIPALVGPPRLPETSPFLGRALLTTYALPFEVVSVLLLAGMVGAIVLARKE